MRYVVLVILLFAGCSGRGWYIQSPLTSEPPIVLYPITPDHIFEIPEGAEVEWEDDLEIVQRDGYFVSEYYLNEIMKARLE